MTHMFDLFPQELYEAAVEAKYIKVRESPNLPYLIHGYTESCAWENAWDAATLQCRGLITHRDTGEVIARPFAKFFNHGQDAQDRVPAGIGLDEVVDVYEKLDGSLGVIYPGQFNAPYVATRGSFISDQAVWATNFLLEKINDKWSNVSFLERDWTYLVEIIYPENRIVVDYGDREDLVLLAAIETVTGRLISIDEAAETWVPGLGVVTRHQFKTLREALEAPPRENAEGYVIHQPERDVRVKVKHDEYLRLHKLVTGTNTRNVWELLANNENPIETFQNTPDEFHAWLKETVAEFLEKFDLMKTAIYDDFVNLKRFSADRKTFAEEAAKSQYRPFMFMLLDGKSIDGMIWKNLRPTAEELRVLRWEPKE